MKEISEAMKERNRKFAEGGKEHRFDSDKARELQKIGVEVRKRNSERKKSMQDIARWLGSMAVERDNLLDPEEILDLKSSKDINMTVNEAMVLAQYQKALTGDTAAAIFLRDTAGEKPKEEIEVHGMTMDEYAQKHKPKF